MKNINLQLDIDGQSEKVIMKFEINGERHKIERKLADDKDDVLSNFLRDNAEQAEDDPINNLCDEKTGFNIDETDNIVLNLSSGLLPEYLQKDEVNLLTNRYGENWFETLGYSEPIYKKPKF